MDEREHELVRLLAEHASLGNGKARQLLGWDEATYEQVKQALVAKGQVAIGRGRGGSISLVGNGSRPAPTASGAPVASTHRVDREGAQGTRGPQANRPNSPEAAEPKAKKPKAVKPEASSRAAERPLGQEAIQLDAWHHKLGNRSALEWVLDQYKEKKHADPTIAEKFNTYRFADHKAHVIDLLKRVCTVSVRTVGVVRGMEKAAR